MFYPLNVLLLSHNIVQKSHRYTVFIVYFSYYLESVGVDMNCMHNGKIHIAVIIVGWNLDYRLELLEGMYEAAGIYQCSLHIYTCMGGSDEDHAFSKGEYDIFDLPDYSLYDGIVFISNTVFAESVVQKLSLRFSSLNIPVVCTDARMKDFGFMGTDNYIAMRSMVEHMVKVHQYKRFKMLAGPKNNRESNLRIKAFKDVLKDNNITVKEEDIYNGNYTMDGALRAIHYFMDNGNELPDVFICANDQMALTTCWELESLGYEVPRDVAVTGFDNISQTLTFQPSITSIGRAKKKMGIEAVKYLVQRILGYNKKVDFYIPYELCIRESCGCNIKPEVSINDFCKKLYHFDMEKRLMEQLSRVMEDDLIGCRNYDGFITSIRNHVPKKFINKYYVCLNQSVADMLKVEYDGIEKFLDYEKNTTNSYDSYFCVPVIYEYGRYNSSEKLSFIEILDLINHKSSDKACEYDDFTYFMPLHFREQCFGFMAFAGNRANIINDFIGNYVRKISNSLEQLRIHRMESLTISKLEELYETDSLTGLYNRFGYKKRIKELITRYENSEDSILVQFFDMDELKFINDAYGHDIGNKAIILVANCMRQVYREEFLIRYGGDEFVALGVNQTESSMKSKNKQFKDMIKKEALRNNITYPIRVSLGYHIAKHPEEADIDKWIKLADKEMYKDKQKKRRTRWDS